MIIQAGIRNVIMRVGEQADGYETVPSDRLVWYND